MTKGSPEPQNGADFVSENTDAPHRLATPGSVAVVILIHRESDLTYLRRGVECVRQSQYRKEVSIIVDNNSGLSTSLRSEFTDATVLTCKENLGFAGGCNVGIDYALRSGAQYVLLLNVDAVVLPETIAELVKGMERHPDAGAVQPAIYNFERRDLIDSVGQQPLAKGGAEDITVRKHEDGDEEIFGACAAVALYRRNVFEHVGAFDRSFFIVHEDTDLSMRMRLAEFRSYLVSSAVAYHMRGVSGRQGKRNSVNIFYTGRNNLIILLRYWPARHLVFYLPLHVARYVRILWCATQCGFSVQDIHMKLRGAIADRRLHKSSPLLAEIQRTWIARKGYRHLLTSFLGRR